MAKRIVTQKNSVFIADLSKIKLSAAQLKSIETGIQEIVMLELAQIDNGGIVMAKPPRKWETRGIVPLMMNNLSDIAIKDIEAQVGNNPFG